MQRGKTAGDLVPRVGDNEELIEMLRAAAAENPSSRASVVGALSPRTPTMSPPSRAPIAARSTYSSAGEPSPQPYELMPIRTASFDADGLL